MTARFRFLGLLFVAYVCSACGGQSSSSNGNRAGNGTSHAGRTSTGGAASTTGGSSGAAGGGHGGSSSGDNGGAGATGTGGTGSVTADEACSGPPTLGAASCSAAFMYYTHDAEHGICRPVLYGGCGGTKNLYKTLEECQAACSDTTPSYDACKEASECVLAGARCCGPCDGPSLTPHDFMAYNAKYAQQVSSCGGIACGACPNVDGELTYKYFFANCVQGRCVVEDLRNSPVNACEQDTDCVLRYGKSCCPCGSGTENLISVRSDGSFEALVCGGTVQTCPRCVSAPFERTAVCSDGHCAIGDP